MMEQRVTDLEKKIMSLKTIIKELHSGKDINTLKKEFKEILNGIKPWEIPFIEQELVKDGISVFEIVRLCDLHVELFRESLLSKSGLSDLPENHPLNDFIRENIELMKDAEKLDLYLRSIKNISNENELERVIKDITNHVKELYDIKKHFMREQLLIFPYIEKRGITAVPRVLWTKQDQLLNKIKKFSALLKDMKSLDKSNYIEILIKEGSEVVQAIMDMIFRENNILYPTLMILLSDGEWKAIKESSNEIGYYKIKPSNNWGKEVKPIYPYQIESSITKEQLEKIPPWIRNQIKEMDTYELIRVNDLALEEGYLSEAEINGILGTLPIDISFIDANDRLRFFNKSRERIFPRSRTVLGRSVELCHPPRSVDVVKKIIEEFKAGRKNLAEFWINMKGRFIHIRYFPVRDKEGNYLGTLEVVQDITDIKKLKGEKRLLDW